MGCTSGCGYSLLTTTAIDLGGYSFLNNRNYNSYAGQLLNATGDYAVIESQLFTDNCFSKKNPKQLIGFIYIFVRIIGTLVDNAPTKLTATLTLRFK